MEAAYRVLRGNRVAAGVRCIIIPGTMQILREWSVNSERMCPA